MPAEVLLNLVAFLDLAIFMFSIHVFLASVFDSISIVFDTLSISKRLSELYFLHST